MQESPAVERPSTRAVVALGLSAALSPLGSTMVAVAIPSIARSFHTTAQAVTPWLVTSYLMVGIVCQSPGGKLGDLLGHQRVLAIGQSVFAMSAFVGFFAQDLVWLALARVLMAASGAVMIPAATALLRNAVPPEQRTRAFGAFGSMMALSATIGPPLGDQITRHFGWPAIFVANAPILLLSVLLARGVAKKDPSRTERPRFDILGSVLLGIALTLAILAVSDALHRKIFLLVAATAFVAFVVWERRIPNPVIDFSLFRSRPFTAGTLIVAFQNLAMYATIFQIPMFFEECRGVAHGVMGVRLAALMIPILVFSFLGGRVAERIGPRATAIAGASIALAGMIWMHASELVTPNDVIPFLLVMGVGLGICGAPTQTSVMSAAPKEQSGMAAGLMSTMRYLGGVVGSAVLATVLGGATLEEKITHHYQAMIVFATSLGLAVVCSLLLPAKAPR